MMEQTRETALQAFDAAHAAFAAALLGVPEAALRYRPAGEDYALGGLAVHVAQVLEKYATVLSAMQRPGDGPLSEGNGPVSEGDGVVSEPPPASGSAVDAALVRDGFDAGQRAAVLERVQGAHGQVAAAIQAVSDAAFTRKVPVLFAGASEPYPTSPADVLGWVDGHYHEHIQQIADLHAAWSAA